MVPAYIGLWLECDTPGGMVRLLGFVNKSPSLRRTQDMYRFMPPMLQVLYAGCERAAPEPADRAARVLRTWYRRVVLNHQVDKGGHPKGPPADFARTREAYLRVLAAIKRDRSEPTDEGMGILLGLELGTEFPIPRTTLQTWIYEKWLPPFR